MRVCAANRIVIRRARCVDDIVVIVSPMRDDARSSCTNRSLACIIAHEFPVGLPVIRSANYRRESFEMSRIVCSHFHEYQSMPRFAILIHDHPVLHWDFLLENGTACRTWRLLTAPDSPVNDFAAEELPDHRLMYLDYEGPVSGGRGVVTRWDVGEFEWLINEPNRCDVQLKGQKWQGVVRLRRDGPSGWSCLRAF